MCPFLQLPWPLISRQILSCRPAQLVEGSLAYSHRHLTEGGIPAELQRELLADACSPDGLQASARLCGNRLAVATVEGSCLVAHPFGHTGERLRLSVLAKMHDGRFRVCNASSSTLDPAARGSPQ